MGRKRECIVNIYGRMWGETGKRGKEGKLIRLGKHDQKDITKKHTGKLSTFEAKKKKKQKRKERNQAIL